MLFLFPLRGVALLLTERILTLLSVLLCYSSPLFAEVRSVTVPITVDYGHIQQLLIQQVFTGAVVLRRPSVKTSNYSETTRQAQKTPTASACSISPLRPPIARRMAASSRPAILAAKRNYPPPHADKQAQRTTPSSCTSG